MHAGLVKLLRRCLTQTSGRMRSYIDASVRFEREARQQVWRCYPSLSVPPAGTAAPLQSRAACMPCMHDKGQQVRAFPGLHAGVDLAIASWRIQP